MRVAVWLILALALFLRVYRVDQLLGFYYDQGRDAKVIWDLGHQGKLFLIGPTTGIEGIFLGPFFYYLLAPAYLIGGGDPVGPAVEVAVINVLGVAALYVIGRKYYTVTTGLVAAGMVAVSFQLVQVQRWLANPAPLPLFALTVVWCLLAIVHGRGKWWHWAGMGLTIGLSLQLEAAAAVFFLPATLFILLVFRRRVQWRWPWLGLLAGAFLITLMPQVIFDLRHQHLLLNAFKNFLVGERSFRPEVTSRLSFYFGAFAGKLVPDLSVAKYWIGSLLVLAVTVRRKIWSPASGLLLIWWLTPLIGLLFYHGNYGYVWDYYFTGVYPAAILLVAAIVVSAWQRGLLAKILIVVMGGIFLQHNLALLKSTLTSGVDGSTHVSLGTSLAAVDWVYQDAADKQFNVDVYVPPVIPHAYDYLFLWRGVTKYRHQPVGDRVNLLYTVYEVDPPHPERLQAWLDRQAGIGTVEEETRFGGVTVQRRQRI